MPRIISGFLCLMATASIGAAFVVPWIVGYNPVTGPVILFGLLIFGTLLEYLVLIDALVHLAQWRQRGWFILLGLLVVLAPSPLILLLAVALPVYVIAGPKGPPLGEPRRAFQSARVPHVATEHPELPREAAHYSLVGLSSIAASRYASWEERLAAFVIDEAILETVLVPLASAVGLGSMLIDSIPKPPNSIDLTSFSLVLLGFALVCLLFVGTIYVLWPIQWARSGRTFGQRALGIRVVTTGGRRVGYGAAFLRAICMFTVDVCIFGIPVGWLWMLVDPKRQAWHDKIASTVVITDVSAGSG